jgi:prepilin-type N-terminal cleavage/methylation domain-containing protein
MSSKSLKNNSLKNENGFTLLETVIAILIITIGLIGTAGAITYALEYSTISKNATNAKQVTTSMIEQLESLRNTRRLNFRQIANVGSVDNTDAVNVFAGLSAGFKEVSDKPGADGVFGTDDDLVSAGADGIYGTPDDFVDNTSIRNGYTREVTVTELSNTVKKVEVKVRYATNAGKIGELRGVCYLNNDGRLSQQ